MIIKKIKKTSIQVVFLRFTLVQKLPKFFKNVIFEKLKVQECARTQVNLKY